MFENQRYAVMVKVKNEDRLAMAHRMLVSAIATGDDMLQHSAECQIRRLLGMPDGSSIALEEIEAVVATSSLSMGCKVKAVRYSKQGLTVEQIASRLNVSKTSVRSWVREAGRGGVKQGAEDLLRKAFRSACIAGDSRLRRTIGKRLRELGISIFKSKLRSWSRLGRELTPQARRAFKLHESGFTTSEIAKQLGVTVTAVDEWIEQYSL